MTKFINEKIYIGEMVPTIGEFIDKSSGDINIFSTSNLEKAAEADFVFKSTDDEAMYFEAQQIFGFNEVYGDLTLYKVSKDYLNLKVLEFPILDTSSKQPHYNLKYLDLTKMSDLVKIHGPIKIGYTLCSYIRKLPKTYETKQRLLFSNLIIDLHDITVNLDKKNEIPDLIKKYEAKKLKKEKSEAKREAKREDILNGNLDHLLWGLLALVAESLSMSQYDLRLKIGNSKRLLYHYIPGFYRASCKLNGINKTNKKIKLMEFLKSHSPQIKNIMECTKKIDLRRKNNHHDDKSKRQFGLWAQKLGKKYRIKGY